MPTNNTTMTTMTPTNPEVINFEHTPPPFIRICIPYVSADLSDAFVKTKINALGIGYVTKISTYKYPNSINRKAFVFVTCKNTNNIRSQKILSMFLNKTIVKIVYRDFLFWKVSLSK